MQGDCKYWIVVGLLVEQTTDTHTRVESPRHTLWPQRKQCRKLTSWFDVVLLANDHLHKNNYRWILQYHVDEHGWTCVNETAQSTLSTVVVSGCVGWNSTISSDVLLSHNLNNGEGPDWQALLPFPSQLWGIVGDRGWRLEKLKQSQAFRPLEALPR